MSMLIAANDWQQIGLRLGLAFVAGSLIGWNRQRTGRAGTRTFILICVGAAMFVMIPLQMESDSQSGTANAISRQLAGVANGVGFLGAGLILKESSPRSKIPEVRGLTTAATVWMTAALGTSIGCGLWLMALMGAFLITITLGDPKRVQHSVKVRIQKRKESQAAVTPETDSDSGSSL